jgi:hypothetical protein
MTDKLFLLGVHGHIEELRRRQALVDEVGRRDYQKASSTDACFFLSF